MQDQTKQIPSDGERRVQRAIVSQTLREDHERGWSRAELEAQLGHDAPITIDDALHRLEREGVIEIAGETVGPHARWPSGRAGDDCAVRTISGVRAVRAGRAHSRPSARRRPPAHAGGREEPGLSRDRPVARGSRRVSDRRRGAGGAGP